MVVLGLLALALSLSLASLTAQQPAPPLPGASTPVTNSTFQKICNVNDYDAKGDNETVIHYDTL
eukprot:SAG31_NODE_8239_length_1491_cov_1.408046_2_plen_64_part_00